MNSWSIEQIQLENLLVDLNNPRHIEQPSQREAIATIAHSQGVKLVKLAEDITISGINPSELPFVGPADQGGLHIVFEGNRRIVALKLLANPNLITLPKQLDTRFKQLSIQMAGNIPSSITCVVVPSREAANHWILLKHTGENAGVGVVPWGGVARQRFRGAAPELQMVDLVRKYDYIDAVTRAKLDDIAITNVKRLLDTPAARQLLGVNVDHGSLLFLLPEEDVARRWSLVIRDIANGSIRVSHLDYKPQRISYAENIAAQPLPEIGGSTPAPSPTAAPVGSSSTPAGSTGTSNIPSTPGATSGVQSTGVGASSPQPGGFAASPSTPTAAVNTPTTAPTSTPQLKPHRDTLIPDTFKLTIPNPRINQIFHDLQLINVNKHMNSCAVMLRVFLELSVDYYAQQKGIPIVHPAFVQNNGILVPARDFSLKEKLRDASSYMKTNGLCTAQELYGINALVSQKDHVLSVDSLNAYVHNMNYNPAPHDLRANWDSVQRFVQELWT